MFVYEIIPSYIFPLLNGVSIFCLASQHTSPGVQDVFTNIFGGADANEGLGLLSVSFDWQYITSASVPYTRNYCNELNFFFCHRYMSLPLIMQANTWVGYFFCYIALTAIFYSNTWNVSTISSLPYSSNIFFAVEIIPYALNGPLFFQRFYLRPNFRLYRAPFPIE